MNPLHPSNPRGESTRKKGDGCDENADKVPVVPVSLGGWGVCCVPKAGAWLWCSDAIPLTGAGPRVPACRRPAEYSQTLGRGSRACLGTLDQVFWRQVRGVVQYSRAARVGDESFGAKQWHVDS